MNIERWTMVRRRDWPHDHGTVLPPGAPVPEPDDDLEVFEVVSLNAVVEALRATRHRPLLTAALHIERECGPLSPNAR